MDDDSTLLKNFIATRDEHAFAQLARRYVDLVYSAARRQVREDAAAADITQQVFVLLAEKARTIRDGEAVAGWLIVTTRYVALNSMRSEARRRRHEREAAVMQQKRQAESSAGGAAASTPAWASVGPMLDEAVAKLKREDRDALALRYLQGRSVADVAAALGVSHDAAQKRLSRALDRLREMFARRGVTTSAEALSTMMMANALIVAPAALGTTVAGAALSTTAAATGGVASGSAKGAVAIMALAKTKLVAAAGVAVVLAGVTGTIAYQQLRTPSGKSRQVRVDPAAVAPAPLPVQTQPADPNWQAGFDSVYLLKPDETLKRVRRPWIAARLDYYRATAGLAQVEATPEGPDVMVLEQASSSSAGGLRTLMSTYGGGKDVRDVLRDVVDVSPEEVDLPAKVKSLPLPGDFVVRAGSTPEARMAAFAEMLSQATRQPYRFVLEPRERDAIVVTGKYAFRPLPNTEQQSGGTLYLCLATPTTKPSYSGAGGGMRESFERLGELTNLPVIIETTLPQRDARNWRIDSSAAAYMRGRREMDAATADRLLANVAKQTSLVLKRERRVVPTWVVATTTGTTRPAAATTTPVATPPAMTSASSKQ